MEVQFIKVNPLTRVALDEEVGKSHRDLPVQLVVEGGTTGRVPGGQALSSLLAPVKKREQMTTLAWSLAKDYADLAQTKLLARALDVDLTLHAPYYVDFFGSQEARERSIRQIQWASILAEGLGARLTVTHLGFYGAGDRADSIQELTEIAKDLSEWLHHYSKGTVRLAIEPSGHPDVFGSREEVLELAHRVKGILPVMNLPHLAARERTTFEDAESLQPVVQQFVEASGGQLYLNFSGVEFYGPGEFRLTPIKRGHVRFDPVAEILSERDYDVTVISSSPLLEHDAMYMKLLYERSLAKRWAKKHSQAAQNAKLKAQALPAQAASKALSRPTARPVAATASHGSGRVPARLPSRPTRKGGAVARRHVR
ncbi:MAG: TIM barrel protein [Thermoplasmata archaeon]|nr:TIM barrel protein [Thermoplasmata archaeon]